MHYLYMYLDPRKPGRFSYLNKISFLFEPIYVGKGVGLRMYDHLNEINRIRTRKSNNIKLNKLKRIIQSGVPPIILVVEFGTEQEILSLETKFIAEIGRIVDKTGPLTNIKVDNSHYSNRKPPVRTSNFRFGRRFTTVYLTNNLGIRVPDEAIEQYSMLGYQAEHWTREKKNNSMSRPGESNPMFGKSAVAGRKWVTLENGQQKFVTPEEISQLTEEFKFCRTVSRTDKKRVILKDAKKSKYMTELEIKSLPSGTQYQFGLLWKELRQTFIVA